MAKHISGFLWSSSEWTVSFLSNGRLQSILFCGASDQHVSKSRHSCYGSNTLIFRQYQGIKKRQWPPIFQPRVRRIRQILRFPSPSNNATVAKRKWRNRTFHENHNEESPCSSRGREVLQTASLLVPESVQIYSADYHWEYMWLSSINFNCRNIFPVVMIHKLLVRDACVERLMWHFVDCRSYRTWPCVVHVYRHRHTLSILTWKSELKEGRDCSVATPTSTA